MSKKKSYTINLSQPCHENWEKMSLAEKGRFCDTCQKQVIDYTLMSDKELAHALKNSPSGCGRFHSSQTDRILIVKGESKSRASFISKMAATLLLLQSINQHSYGQTNNLNKQETSAANTQSSKYRSKAWIIQGKLIDTASKRPVPGVRIVIQNTDISTVTDANGRFRMELPRIYRWDYKMVGPMEGRQINTDDSSYIPYVFVWLKNRPEEVILHRKPIDSMIINALSVNNATEKPGQIVLGSFTSNDNIYYMEGASSRKKPFRARLRRLFIRMGFSDGHIRMPKKQG